MTRVLPRQGLGTQFSSGRKFDGGKQTGAHRQGGEGAPVGRADKIGSQVAAIVLVVEPETRMSTDPARTAEALGLTAADIPEAEGAVIPDRTHSERSAHFDVFLVGANLAF